MVGGSPADGSDPKRGCRGARCHTTDSRVCNVADVGTALPRLAGIVTEALAALRARGERDWHGWLVAARLPTVLARLDITATPLPCLTGLARAMRYSTAGASEIEGLLVPRLGEQARDGLALLRRLDACARAWRGRLAGLTARSRAGQAAACSSPGRR